MEQAIVLSNVRTAETQSGDKTYDVQIALDAQRLQPSLHSLVRRTQDITRADKRCQPDALEAFIFANDIDAVNRRERGRFERRQVRDTCDDGSRDPVRGNVEVKVGETELRPVAPEATHGIDQVLREPRVLGGSWLLIG